MDFASHEIHGNFHTSRCPRVFKMDEMGHYELNNSPRAHLIEFPNFLRPVFLKMVQTEEKMSLNNDHQIIFSFIESEQMADEK